MDGLLNSVGASIYFGNVLDNKDKSGAKRVKVAIYPADKRKSVRDIPYASPLLPKLIHIVPKMGELVMIFCEDAANPNSQRYYLGPVISQPYNMFYEGSLTATSMLQGGVAPEGVPAENYGETHGALPKDEEIAIIGRKNSDLILSDNDARLRCGVRVTKDNARAKVEFNKQSPAFIKLKYYPNELQDKTKSSATIVADKINLLSQNGQPFFNMTDVDEGISDEEMEKIIARAHKLPYGDILVDFLSKLLTMFKSHTHKYHNMPPCPDPNSVIFDSLYDNNKESLEKTLLSNSVRIN